MITDKTNLNRAQYMCVPNDGATFRCRECETNNPAHNVVLISPRTFDKWIPGVICKLCLTELWGNDWETTAENVTEYTNIDHAITIQNYNDL